MKNLFRISEAILLVLSIFFIQSCKKEKPSIPTLTTTDASAITQIAATSGGNITSDGGSAITARGVCWSTAIEPTIADSKTNDGLGIGSFVSSIQGLSPKTTYFVRAYATNIVGTAYGIAKSCATDPATLPVINTTTISSITQTTAMSGGTIITDGAASVTARGVCWGTAQNPTIVDNITSDGTGVGEFISDISGLIGNTTYYVRAYSTNSIGTAYGNQVSFTTSPLMPTLTTLLVSSITAISCNTNETISSDGGSPVIAFGVCFGTSHNPTLADSKTIDGSGTGYFVSYITGLQMNMIYFVRAYAINTVGTQYGNEITVKTLETITDIDGNVYNIASIGTQIWMAENLKTTKYYDGTNIPLVTVSADWNNLPTPAYCWYNNDEVTNKVTYGALYNWYVIGTGKLCPTGWHVPTDDEWTTLASYEGGNGGKLKETGTIHWAVPNTGATNESSFTGLPGGQRFVDGSFINFGSTGTWWSSTEWSPSWAWYRGLSSINTYLDRSTYYKFLGQSVRCIKDN